MKPSLGRVILLVKDYDEALAFYEKNFFCRTLFDAEADGRRYLHIAFPGDEAHGIWLMQAEGEPQRRLIGSQTGGQPVLVVYVSEIERFAEHLRRNGVIITENLVKTPESSFFHCLDLYGNRIVVAEVH